MYIIWFEFYGISTIVGYLTLLFSTNNSIKPQSFVYTQLKDQTVLFQTILFSISQNWMAPSIAMYH